MRKKYVYIYVCMCDWVTLLYSRKLTECSKPNIMEKIKIIKKKKRRRRTGRNSTPSRVTLEEMSPTSKKLLGAGWKQDPVV